MSACRCETRITARIIDANPETFHRLRGAKLTGWTHIESSGVESVSQQQIDIVMTGFGDRVSVERGLRELVPNAVDVRET